MHVDLSQKDRPNLAVTARSSRSRALQRGQGLMIFVASIVFLIGLLSIVVDITWYWANSLQVQRAADSAALAGAVWLPEKPATATTVALASAKQNGYETGPGVTVTAVQNSARDVELDTSVSAPVPTFFMRLFGIDTIQATRTAKAEYVLPVPMGSPLNYFGAFGDLRGWIHTDTGRDLPDPGLRYPSALKNPSTGAAGWTNLSSAFNAKDAVYATTTGTTAQGFGTFNLPLYGTAQQFKVLGGIEVTVTGHANKASGCQLKVDVTPDAGANWYGSANPFAAGEASPLGASQTFTTTDADYTFGGHLSTGATDTGDWFGKSNWVAANFSNANFVVRLTPVGSGCTDSIDSVGVKVTYEGQDPPVVGPGGESLIKQGVWATALSQGADIVNGDLYSPENNGSGSNAQYSNPSPYYNYAIEMQPGTAGGSVYVFDPVFCGTNGNGSQGMGDRWFGSGAMSTFYDLFDTNNTPYDLTDDTWIAGNSGPSGAANPLYNLFRRSNGTDTDQGGPSVSSGRYDCRRGQSSVDSPTEGGYWHNRWWPLASGLAGPTGITPRIYRVRVTTTDPASASDQDSTNGQNSFSLFANVGGRTCPNTPADALCPRVYGLGTMEAFSPLDPNEQADMYMSQIGVTYAGKTIKVSLWDPGDTGVLRADLSFLKPTSAGYVVAPFTWTATRISTGANCSTGPGSTTSLRTNNGGSSPTTGLFNGCLLTINLAVDPTYTAPTPPGEPGPGWWKIRYTMGPGATSGFDLTTWKTQIVGNPVHLIVP